MILLEGPSFNSSTGDLGILLFAIASIAFCVAVISLFMAFIMWLVNSNRDESYKSPLKVGLISLLIFGVSLLLTSLLCSWWN